jgi:hypothetical protein
MRVSGLQSPLEYLQPRAVLPRPSGSDLSPANGRQDAVSSYGLSPYAGPLFARTEEGCLFSLRLGRSGFSGTDLHELTRIFGPRYSSLAYRTSNAEGR